MKPSIATVRKVCEAIGARQLVVIAFDDRGQFAVTSYGVTKAECEAARPVCEAIAAAIEDGLIPAPRARR